MHSPNSRLTNLAERIGPFLTEIVIPSLGDRECEKCLNAIFYLLLNSKVLYVENSQDSDDALQVASLALYKKLKKLARSGISMEPLHLINWWKKYLKWELFKIKVRPLPLPLLEPDSIPAPQDSISIFETLAEWIDEDPDRILRQSTMKRYPDVSAQIVLKHRLVNNSWREISKSLNVPISSLSSFFTRQCLPLLRKFAQSEIYLDR
jgi:hypothetical protein